MTFSSHAPFTEQGWGMLIRDVEYLTLYVTGSNDVRQDAPQAVQQSNDEPLSSAPPQLTGFDGLGGAGNLGQPSQRQATSSAVPYPISATNGGTGISAPTAHGVLIAEGSAPMVAVTTTTAGLPLISGGTGVDPSFTALGVVGGGTGATTAAGARTNIGLGGTPSFLSVTTFVTSGTWTVPAGVTSCFVIVVGGGAGGGGGHATLNIAGGGAGAGGVAYGYFSVTGGAGASVTVGGAGSGGAIGATGSSGGSSAFNAGITANGGSPGQLGFGGFGGTGQTATGARSWATPGQNGANPAITSYSTAAFNLTAGGSAQALTAITQVFGVGGQGVVWQTTQYGLGGNGGGPGNPGVNGQPGIVIILY